MIPVGTVLDGSVVPWTGGCEPRRWSPRPDHRRMSEAHAMKISKHIFCLRLSKEMSIVLSEQSGAMCRIVQTPSLVPACVAAACCPARHVAAVRHCRGSNDELVSAGQLPRRDGIWVTRRKRCHRTVSTVGSAACRPTMANAASRPFSCADYMAADKAATALKWQRRI